jgi:CO/xanthine dehydrogenase FAD-binding subunit
LAQNLIGLRLDKAKTRAVAHEAAATLEPDSDIHASSAYRRHLAGVLAKRVLQSAYDNARAAR